MLRNVEAVGSLDTEKGIAELGRQAYGGKLTIEDMAGLALSPYSSSFFSPWVHAYGTDAVYDNSNGSIFSSWFGTPIINLLQTAVLGIHTIKGKPIVVNGQIVVRPIMVVALTYDRPLLQFSLE